MSASMKTNNVQILQFNERFCGRKVAKEKPLDDNEDHRLNNDVEKVKVFNIKHARYEIMRFALNGLDKEKQRQSKIAMAIRLGAKPPKKEYKNYKILMEEKLQEKLAKQNEPKSQCTLRKLKGRKMSKAKKKKNKNPSII